MPQGRAINRSDVFQYGQWLIVEFPDALKTLSRAVYGGGVSKVNKVVWRRANNLEINQCLDPQGFLQEKFDQDNITGAIGVLTSASLDSYTDIEKSFGPYWVRCIATVGLGNALRVGDPPTGTGTDCIVIDAPDDVNGSKYAGKHTVLGHLIGSSVAEAVRLGVQRWKVNETMQQ